MDFFYKFATGPEALPDLFFRAVSVRVRATVRVRVRVRVRVIHNFRTHFDMFFQ